MDPNVCRANMIVLANLVLASASDQENIGVDVELAEAVHDMDEWLRSGGFFPSVWTRGGGAVNRGRKQDVDVSVPVSQPSKMVDDERPLVDGNTCGYPMLSDTLGKAWTCSLDRGHDGPHT